MANAHTSNWEIVGESVGSGSFGVAYKCQRKLEFQNVQILIPGLLKLLRSPVSGHALKDDFLSFLEEVSALSTIESRFVAQLLDAGLGDDNFWLVTEFVSGISLERKLKETGKLRLADWLVLADNSLRGLSAIHEANFVHLDLKPSNIMFGLRDESYVIVDLGISKWQRKMSPVDSRLVGAIFYSPPESFQNSYSSASDIFCLGTTLYEALFGFNVWEEIARNSVATFDSRQSAAKWAVNQTIPETLLGSTGVERILRSMLEVKPSSRPSARVCRNMIEHEFNSLSSDLVGNLRNRQALPSAHNAHKFTFDTWKLIEGRVEQLLDESGFSVFKLDAHSPDYPEIKFRTQTKEGKTYLTCSRAPNSGNFVQLGWTMTSEREMIFELAATNNKRLARVVRDALESGFGLPLEGLHLT